MPNIDFRMEDDIRRNTCTLSVTDKQGTLTEQTVHLNTIHVTDENGKAWLVSGLVEHSTFNVYSVEPATQING